MSGYLVTGAGGFIGNRLCEKLMGQKAYVKAILRKPLDITKQDKAAWNESLICDLDDVEEERLKTLMKDVDCIFHLAGIAHTQEIADSVYDRINVEVTRKLLGMATTANVRTFIYFSSIKAIESNDAYGRSKLAAEKLVLNWGLQNNRYVCILRPVLVYGRGMKGNLAQMMKGIQQGWFPPIPETHNRRSLVWVEDVINAALTVNEKIQIANGNTYTISENKVYSSREIYNLMREALKLPAITFAFPIWFWKLTALSGDILEKILRKPMPFNSKALQKLLGSSQYFATQLEHELGWTAKGDLLTELKNYVK